jgi:L-fuconolactonase
MNIPIVDTHLHIWDPGRIDYPWLAGAPKLNRPHLLEHYRAATEGLTIEKMVFVQCEADCSQYADEVAWVTEQARIDPRILGIVAWAPLEKGEAARDELAKLAANPLVRGIRRIIQFEQDPGFCLHPGFVDGVRLLSEFDLSFDICIKGDEQFRNALELVRRCPGVRFIADHINKPFIKERITEPWASYMSELAGLPNTWCKMSGLINEADWESWTPSDLKPYIKHVFDCFGAERVMFGGDWPVCTLAGTYRRWTDTLWDAVSGLSGLEKRKLFHDNGEKFYRVQAG